MSGPEAVTLQKEEVSSLDLGVAGGILDFIVEPRRFNMSNDINRDRRRFFGTAAMTVAAAQLAWSGGAANAQPVQSKPSELQKVRPGTTPRSAR